MASHGRCAGARLVEAVKLLRRWAGDEEEDFSFQATMPARMGGRPPEAEAPPAEVGENDPAAAAHQVPKPRARKHLGRDRRSQRGGLPTDREAPAGTSATGSGPFRCSQLFGACAPP
jgi:hypothetical protein